MKKTYKLNLKPSPIDDRDYLAESIFVESSDLDEECDLRSDLQPVRDQGNFGTCASMTASCMKEWQEKKDVDFNGYMSPQFIYNNRENQDSDGMYSRDVMKILNKIGSVTEEDYPYENNSPISDSLKEKAKKYTIKGYAQIKTIEGLKKALVINGPCYIAFPVFNFGRRFWKPEQGDVNQGGHALCCHPNTQIVTNEGIKNIENIKIGDMVMTRKGFKPVINKFSREINENIYHISSNLSLEPLKITKEHPVLAKKCSEKTKINLLRLDKSEFINASELKKGYFIQTKICDDIVNNNISENMARLFGYYIGDGNLQLEYYKNTQNLKSGKFRLTYHRDDKREIIEDLINIINEYDSKINYSIYECKNQNCNIISFYSTKLTKLIMYYCGKAKNKDLTNLLFIEPKKQLEIIKGWYKTDGTAKWLDTSRIFTAEKNLADQLLFMLQRNKLNYSTVILDERLSNIKGKLYKCKKLYDISFNNKNYKSRFYYRDSTIFTRIKKIDFMPYKGRVYNLEIDYQHEYIANNLVVHNCTVGYNKLGFILRNSWGNRWNGDGYTIFPYEDFGMQWEIWTAIDEKSPQPYKPNNAKKSWFDMLIRWFQKLFE